MLVVMLVVIQSWCLLSTQTSLPSRYKNPLVLHNTQHERLLTTSFQTQYLPIRTSLLYTTYEGHRYGSTAGTTEA